MITVVFDSLVREAKSSVGTHAHAQHQKTQDKAQQQPRHATGKAPVLTPLLSLHSRQGLDLNNLCLALLMNTSGRHEGGWESQLFQFSAAIQLLFHERVGVRELKATRLSTFFFNFIIVVPCYIQPKPTVFYRDTGANCQAEAKGVTSSETCRLSNLQNSMIVCFFAVSEAIYMAIFKLNDQGCGANTVQGLFLGAFRCHTFLSRG